MVAGVGSPGVRKEADGRILERISLGAMDRRLHGKI